MKILLLGEDWYGALGRICKRALTDLGCEVRCFDFWQEIRGLTRFAGVPVLRKWERKKLGRRISEKFVHIAREVRPDLLFVIKGEWIWTEALKRIKKRTSDPLLINWNPDNPFNRVNASKDLIDSIPLYDLHLTWGRFLIPLLMDAGARKVAYFPFGYEPDLHCKVDVSEKEVETIGSDVVFVGTWDREREAILEHLTNYDLAIWGNNWERLSKRSALRRFVRGTARYGRDMSKLYNASKIALNFIRRQNGDAHNMRTFEIPACGGFMLTTRTTEQRTFFVEGKEMACFKEPEELKRKIDHYLQQESERIHIAEQGRNKVIQGGHTYLERMKQMLSMVDGL